MFYYILLCFAMFSQAPKGPNSKNCRNCRNGSASFCQMLVQMRPQETEQLRTTPLKEVLQGPQGGYQYPPRGVLVPPLGSLKDFLQGCCSELFGLLRSHLDKHLTERSTAISAISAIFAIRALRGLGKHSKAQQNIVKHKDFIGCYRILQVFIEYST